MGELGPVCDRSKWRWLKHALFFVQLVILIAQIYFHLANVREMAFVKAGVGAALGGGGI